jgi:hypothetical protein
MSIHMYVLKFIIPETKRMIFAIFCCIRNWIQRLLSMSLWNFFLRLSFTPYRLWRVLTKKTTAVGIKKTTHPTSTKSQIEEVAFFFCPPLVYRHFCCFHQKFLEYILSFKWKHRNMIENGKSNKTYSEICQILRWN